jgi:hypothetical protein
MKKNIVLTAMLGVALAFGLVLVGCASTAAAQTKAVSGLRDGFLWELPKNHNFTGNSIKPLREPGRGCLTAGNCSILTTGGHYNDHNPRTARRALDL